MIAHEESRLHLAHLLGEIPMEGRFGHIVHDATHPLLKVSLYLVKVGLPIELIALNRFSQC
jgi:hypothetical protein